ncbi:hypothetical protein FKM82_030426 [Ascaphus truei]
METMYIVAGIGFGVFFVIFVLVFIIHLCKNCERHEQRHYNAATEANAISVINSQFNTRAMIPEGNSLSSEGLVQQSYGSSVQHFQIPYSSTVSQQQISPHYSGNVNNVPNGVMKENPPSYEEVMRQT